MWWHSMWWLCMWCPCRCKKLQRLDASNNMLQRVPPALGHLKGLKELNLR